MEFVDFNPESIEWNNDLNSVGITHTMERQIQLQLESHGEKIPTKPYISLQRAFSTPFFYDGLRLGGLPFFVDCGENNFRHIEECEDLQLCVMGRSTHTNFARSVLPERRITLAKGFIQVLQSFVNGTCNVFLMEAIGVTEAVVRAEPFNYDGIYAIGTSLYTKEPLALVSASADRRWSDFINVVFHGLLVAEQHNITQSSANLFPQTDVFGKDYKDMFRNAIAAVGNYGEIYQRHMESFLPREPMNTINNGTGLMYSHPMRFSEEEAEERQALGPILRAILDRGRLRCGVRLGRPGFASRTLNATTIGMDIDYCRGIAASLFQGDASAVDFVELASPKEGFQKLANTDIDLLAGAMWNLENDVKEPVTGLGFAFSKPYFYGYSEEEDNLCLVTRQDDHDWASYVYWIVEGIVFAEEEDITQEFSNDMPLVPVFGSGLRRMFRDVVLTIGNYAEVYDRNVAVFQPRSGRNLLNSNQHHGPQHYPMPGLFENRVS